MLQLPQQHLGRLTGADEQRATAAAQALHRQLALAERSPPERNTTLSQSSTKTERGSATGQPKTKRNATNSAVDSVVATPRSTRSRKPTGRQYPRNRP